MAIPTNHYHLINLVRLFPSPLLFAAIRAYIDTLPRNNQFIPLVEATKTELHSWPVNACDVVLHIDYYGDGAMNAATISSYAAMPSWPLVKTLRFTSESAEETNRLLEEIDVSSIVHLALCGPTDDQTLSLLANRSRFSRLETLDFQRNKLPSSDSLRRFAASATAKGLCHLVIGPLQPAVTAEAVRALFADTVWPNLQKLNLALIDQSVFAGMDFSSLPHLQELTLVGDTDRFIAEVLSSADQASRLESLDLGRADDKCIEAVARCNNLHALRRLYFGGGQLTPDAILSLRDVNFCPNLTDLSFSGVTLGDPGWSALGELPCRQLQHLNLQLSHGSDEGIISLCNNLNLDALKTLDLSRNQIGEFGGRTLANWPNTGRLNKLNLYDNPIGNMAGQALASSNLLRHVSFLNMAMTNLTTASLVNIFAATAPNLRDLCLAGNEFNEEAAAALSASAKPAVIERLDLGSCGLVEQALVMLFGKTNWPNLHSLQLYNNKITSAGLATITSNPSLSALWELDLTNNPIGDDEAAILAGPNSLKQLVRLHIKGGNFNLASSASLARALAARHIEYLALEPNLLSPWLQEIGLRPVLRTNLSQWLNIVGEA